PSGSTPFAPLCTSMIHACRSPPPPLPKSSEIDTLSSVTRRHAVRECATGSSGTSRSSLSATRSCKVAGPCPCRVRYVAIAPRISVSRARNPAASGGGVRGRVSICATAIAMTAPISAMTSGAILKRRPKRGCISTSVRADRADVLQRHRDAVVEDRPRIGLVNDVAAELQRHAAARRVDPEQIALLEERALLHIEIQLHVGAHPIAKDR